MTDSNAMIKLAAAAAAAVPAANIAHWALFKKNPDGISRPSPLPLVGNALSIPATLTTEFLIELPSTEKTSFYGFTGDL